MELSDIEYLGTPYSNGSCYLINFRAEMVDFIASELTKQGRCIYSPISSWHLNACRFNMPKTFEFWQHLNLSFLSKSKKLIVVMLPGWEISVGLQDEIRFAKENNIEIEYLDPTPYFEMIKVQGEY
jgi:hypothetical protein